MRRSDQRRDAVFACYQHDVTDRPIEELIEDSKTFTKDLVRGVQLHRDELDALIEANLRGWTMDRLAPLDHNIMRVALYESGYRDDVPSEVAIDEAVEIAKRYCGADAPSFINGVLGAVIGTAATTGAGDE